jgi:leucyl aminopeptidase
MRLSRRLLAPALVALLAVLSPPPLSPQEPPLWITLERAAADALGAALARRGAESSFTVAHDGRLVVGRLAPEEVPLLTRLMHERFRRCGGFMVHDTEAAALAEAARDPQLEAAALVDYTIDNGPVVQAMLPQLQEANIRDTITNLSAFNNRYYTAQSGVDAASWLRNRWLGYAQGRGDVTVSLFSHAAWAQPSVVMTITGATLPSEVVVIGGHLDSINSGSPATGRAPGADDDASGVASFTESLRVALAMGYRPARTVKFIAYAAEEVGLRGSQEIANRHRTDGVNVVGVLQLDMTNYKGSTNDIAIITDNTNAAQNGFVGALVDTYLGLPRANTACGYACSDHASWTSAGFVASFPFEAQMGQHNPTIHTANDTLAQSGNNATHALKFARLTTAYLAELAKGTLPGGGNLPPSAGAGPDKSAPTGTSVTLDGSGADPDGGPSPLSFAWSQVSGPATSIGNATQPVANVTPSTAGTYVFRLTVSDGAAQASDEMTLTATSGTALTAAFDTALRAPRCSAVGSSCDSAALLTGRDGRGPEPNQPNTINASCTDGTSGTFHVDESNDRIRVSTTDGGLFAAGKTVRVEATVWAWTTPSSDRLDLYYAANAASPTWTFLATLTPSAAGAQTLSATYTLPAGALQAVRARFRYQGAAAACAAGSYIDHDDLVFAVTAPPPATTVFADDFETDKGWTRNAGGTDTATSGLWERGDPEATDSSGPKQLGTAGGGLNDLVTGRLAGASAGVHDVDGGVTSILSPPITLPATGTLTLSFKQYLAHGTNATSADFLRVFVVGATTTQVLQRLGAATDVDAAWTTSSANISAFAGQTIRIRIEAADAGTASLVEAAVDDVVITRQ